MLENSNDLLQQRYGFAEMSRFVFGQSRECFCERFYSALAALPQNSGAFGGGGKPDAAPVFRWVAANQSGALEAGDDAAHGGRANLLGLS